MKTDGLYYMKAWTLGQNGSPQNVFDVAIDNGLNRSTVTDSPNLAFKVRPGQKYSFHYSSAAFDWADVHFDVPAGYALRIGAPFSPTTLRSGFRAQGKITYPVDLELVPADGLATLAAGYGTAPSLQPDVNWGISLGALPGGSWAGAIRWWQRAFDANLLSNTSLRYDPPLAQGVLAATYADGSLKYVDADNVQIVIERGALGGYWIKFYGGDVVHSTITNDDHVPIMYDAAPFVTYEVSNPAGNTFNPENGVLIKRLQPFLDVNGNPSTREDRWLLRRNSNGQMMVSQADGTRVTSVVSTTPVNGLWTETTTIGATSGAPLSKVQRKYKAFPWGTELIEEVNDPDGAALTSTYSYYEGSYTYNAPPTTTGAIYWQPANANIGKLRKVTRPDGSWETYTYYTEQDRFGQLRDVTRPWLNAVDENASPVQVTTIGYAAEAIGSGFNNNTTNPNTQIIPPLSFRTEVAGSVTTVGTTVVSRTYLSDGTGSDSATGGRLPVFAPLVFDLRSDYGIWPAGDAPVRTDNTRVFTSATDSLLTIRRTLTAWAHPDLAGRLYSQVNPDGTKVSASYLRGTFNDRVGTADWAQTTFVPGAGAATAVVVLQGVASDPGAGLNAVRYITDGLPNGRAIDPVWLVPGKSTRRQTISDSRAQPVLNLVEVFTGTGFQLIAWEKRTYHLDGTLASRQDQTGALWSGTYAAGRLQQEVSSDGSIRTYTYNNLGLLTQEERLSQPGDGVQWPEVGRLTTHHLVDLLGRVTQSSQTGSTGGAGRIVSRTYDLAGRVSSETAETGLTTTHSYAEGGRVITTTFPDGQTRVIALERDGSLKSVTGTSVVAEFHSVVVNPNGTITRQVNSGASNSVRWTRNTADLAGRLVRQEWPTTLPGITKAKTAVFNAVGQLARIEQTGLANTLFTYNTLGELEFSGLDVDKNGSLELASADRITRRDARVVQIDGVWWSQQDAQVYQQANSSTATLRDRTRFRLVPYDGAPADYSSGRARGETRTWDIFGNLTRTTSVADRASRLLTTTVDVPDSTVDDVSWTRNGVLVRRQTSHGLVHNFHYDTFLRLVKETNPRTDPTSQPRIGYFAQSAPVGSRNQIEWQEDSAGNRTTYTYEANSGRLASVTAPMGRVTYRSYNTRGQVAREWGAAAYPVEYIYNDLGERTEMRTFRAGSGWTNSTWPAPSGTGIADTTTWIFDPATGLLKEKKDAGNRSVLYTYNGRNTMASRKWHRNVTTTYAYSDSTGELLSVVYSDGTPSVTYEYNRQGLPQTIGDATGSRNFEYCECGKPQYELLDAARFGGRKITWKIDATTPGAIGRNRGYTLAVNGGAVEQDVDFAYDALGRLSSVSEGQTNWQYAYLANSGHVASVTQPTSGWTQSRTWLPNRDLLDVISTHVNGAEKASFDYDYDLVGRRKSVAQTGEMFRRYSANGLEIHWAYNVRSELEGEVSRLGGTLTTLPGRQDSYEYDNVGNRKTTTHNGTLTTWSANQLNQYVTRTADAVSVDVAGFAPAAAEVRVNNLTAGIARQGDYFFSTQPAAANTWNTFSVSSSLGGSESRSSFTPLNPEAFEHDVDGNLESDGRWKYTYDAENRVVSMQTKLELINNGVPASEARRIEFVNDYLGRRVEKVVLGWGGVGGFNVPISWQRFIYDGWNLIGDYTVSSSSLSAARVYTWGLDLQGNLKGSGGVGGLLAAREVPSGTVHLPAYDGNGNVMGMLNRTSGAFTAIYEYDAFGKTLRAEGTFAQQNPFRFSTRFTDVETGAIYYGLRYYSPSLGRFINRDPIEERGGINLYAFVGNAATNRWDFLGMDMVAIDAGNIDRMPIIQLPRIVFHYQSLATIERLMRELAQNYARNVGRDILARHTIDLGIGGPLVVDTTPTSPDPDANKSDDDVTKLDPFVVTDTRATPLPDSPPPPVITPPAVSSSPSDSGPKDPLEEKKKYCEGLRSQLKLISQQQADFAQYHTPRPPDYLRLTTDSGRAELVGIISSATQLASLLNPWASPLATHSVSATGVAADIAGAANPSGVASGAFDAIAAGASSSLLADEMSVAAGSGRLLTTAGRATASAIGWISAGVTVGKVTSSPLAAHHEYHYRNNPRRIETANRTSFLPQIQKLVEAYNSAGCGSVL
jgi:RHS repeat-associated protein